MAVECGVIVGVFVLLVLIFFRRGHKEWAVATLPLILLPIADFVMEVVLIRMLKVKLTAFVAILVLVCAVVASAAWIGGSSAALRAKQHGKRSVATFVAISNVFNIALAFILILNIMDRAEQLEEIYNPLIKALLN